MPKIQRKTLNFANLSERIIALSEADRWHEAKMEWQLSYVFISETPETCLCGHSPIRELCVIENRVNGKETIVGNVCVKKFMGISSDHIFQAIARVTRDNTAALNFDTLYLAHRNDWISKWGFEFYQDTMRKRKLSPKQLSCRVQINKTILYHFAKNKGATT